MCKNLEQLSEADAARTNSIKIACEYCASVVWVVPRNLIIKEKKNAKIACTKCARRLVKEEIDKGEEVFEIPAAPVAEKLLKEEKLSNG